MLDTRTELLDGQELRVARLGGGYPLIMLHGYPENLQVYSQLAPGLAAHHEVIAFDWPGMGYSAVWKGGATPLIMADRLLALMDKWGIEQADIVGQDMGGQPALVFAARYPARVRSVVVMNALITGDNDTSWEIKWLRKFGLNRLLMKYGAALVFRRALSTFLPHGYLLDKALREDMWQVFRKRQVRDFIVRMCAGYEAQLHRLPDYYKQVTCPVLILWGARDKHFPPAQAYSLKEMIPNAELQIIDGGHWMVLANTAVVRDKMEAFYSTISS